MAQQTKTQSAGASSAGTNLANAEIAADAYIFGYPLVLMDVTRALSTAVTKPEAARAPVNQFAHLRAFPNATFTDVVSPNADTLYSAAWLDLSAEPIVLSVPDMGKRYYLMPMIDAWTNVFASPGTRTTGNGKGSFAIVGPIWTGPLPDGLTAIESPTNMVWIIGRTQTNGKQDFAAVNAIQDQYTLTPLSAWGKAQSPRAELPVDASIDTKTPPAQQVAAMDAAAFFSRLNTLMVTNPPSVGDGPALARFNTVGVGPGKALDTKSLDPALAAALKSAQANLVAAAAKSQGTQVNGWDIFPDTVGKYGTDYPMRAVVALIGLGANLNADAIYPHATTDTTGQPLTGANKYVIRFPKDALPPVKAFWSVTMYNAKQAFVANPINRYAIGDRDHLAAGSDGSVTLYIQKDSPGKERESNWLPAPADSFNLVMRLYWPEQAIVDGTWRPPGVERANATQ